MIVQSTDIGAAKRHARRRRALTEPRDDVMQAMAMAGRFMMPAAVASGSGLTQPDAIFGALEWWFRADLLTQASGTVSSWTDKSGNARHATEATNQPAYNATGGPLSGPCVTGDGTNDKLGFSWTRASPGTQPFYVWMIAKQITWTNNDSFMGDSNCVIFQRTTTPSVAAKCSTQSPLNGAATIGSWFRFEAQFGNSGADYFRIGGTTVTQIMGNVAGGGTWQLFASGASTLFANVAICEAFCFLGVASSGQRASADAYCDGTYGGGLT